MAQGNNGEIGDGRVKWGNLIGREVAAEKNGEIENGRVKGKMERTRAWLRDITRK